MRAGGTAPAILNAANEVAVAAFLEKKISFLAIPHLIGDVLAALPLSPVRALEDVLAADAMARDKAVALLPEVALA